MFNNKQISKEHGESVRKSFEKSDRATAAEAGKQAEAIKLAALDKWTRENVGLD